MRAGLSAKGLTSEQRRGIAEQLPEFLVRQRWFGGKARALRSAEVADVVPMGAGREAGLVLVVRVKYEGGAEESYAVPVARAKQGAREAVSRRLEVGGARFDDALGEKEFLGLLLACMKEEKTFAGEKGKLRGVRTSAFAGLYDPRVERESARLISGEQSNSSAIYGDTFILKFIRRMEEGENPDLEVGRFLTERAHAKNVARLAGYLEYIGEAGGCVTQGILQEFVANEGDAWRHIQKALPAIYRGDASAAKTLRDEIGLLGRRTAELHLALASAPRDPVFGPEAFTPEFQQGLLASLEDLARRTVGLLCGRMSSLDSETRKKSEEVSAREEEIQARFRDALRELIEAERIRIHGDYHLGQVLYTGSDFVIIDFEGEPMKALAERRTKQSPLQDVAGMLRSFHYAAFAPLLMPRQGEALADQSGLRRLAEEWNREASEEFLREYFATCDGARFVPANEGQRTKLLNAYLLGKAVYELGYELNNRPSWVRLPVEGILTLLRA